MYEIKVNGTVKSTPVSETEAYETFAAFQRELANKSVEMIEVTHDSKGCKNRTTVHKFSR